VDRHPAFGWMNPTPCLTPEVDQNKRVADAVECGLRWGKEKASLLEMGKALDLCEALAEGCEMPVGVSVISPQVRIPPPEVLPELQEGEGHLQGISASVTIARE